MTRPDRRRPPLRPYTQLSARPWFLAPPLRVVTTLDRRELTMHTIQSREEYETLVREGLLVGDSTRGWPDFQEAYGWMLRQMDRRLQPPHEGLLWLWPSATRATLRQSARYARGDVLLTVTVPRERVLVSEFSDWHAVLNRCLHAPQLLGETHVEREQRWKALDDAFDRKATPYLSLPLEAWPPDVRRELEASWEAIFDPSTWRPNADLQATTRELRTADIVRAVRIR